MQTQGLFVKRLKEARTAAGLSQKELGMLSGMDEFSSCARINQYETGKLMPDFNTVEQLADALNVPAAYFYARDDELAKLILAFFKLDKAARNKILRELNIG